MQHDVLPSVDTPNLKIQYQVVTSLFHESVVSTKKNLPSLEIPMTIALDTQGCFDTGNEYAAEREQ